MPLLNLHQQDGQSEAGSCIVPAHYTCASARAANRAGYPDLALGIYQ